MIGRGEVKLTLTPKEGRLLVDALNTAADATWPEAKVQQNEADKINAMKAWHWRELARVLEGEV